MKVARRPSDRATSLMAIFSATIRSMASSPSHGSRLTSNWPAPCSLKISYSASPISSAARSSSSTNSWDVPSASTENHACGPSTGS